ncbi:hypothetical protein ATI02_4704 [Pseudomonas baetica]|uniref:Uncharacterized protein n=1 Tax=Pseudomonas baetica TaxID=674054 RepID=A0ABX4Q4J1_9PSED|nr:hypothetical protein [Pseudomonas baetica]PKA71708.1 hypothetical protein ATI02_4704 [Pseudomonas baetica]
MLFANYRAIRADFRALWGTPHGTDEQAAIDRWLLRNAAFISTSQAAAQGINTPIVLDGRRVAAWRPPRYGRAAVLCALESEQVLFDIKGIGVPPDEAPVLPYSNGLLTLAEAVHEVLMEHLVFAAMAHAGGAITPLPAYALIDLGFDALLQAELLLRRYGLTASSCGAVRFQVSREAGALQVRRDGEALAVSQEVARMLERLLADHQGAPLLIDGVNVQLAGATSVAPLRLKVMDFGRYRFAERFDHHLYAWIDADYQNLNGLYLAPGDPRYVQPDPDLSLARTAEGRCFAELERRVGGFRQGTEPDRLCQALRATLEKACRPLRRPLSGHARSAGHG